MKERYRTQSNYDWTKEGFVETSGLFPSETKPGEAFEMKELLERHATGRLTDLEIARPRQYAFEEPGFDDPDLEQISRMSEMERAEYYDELLSEERDVRQRVQKLKDAEAAFAAQQQAAKAGESNEPQASKTPQES